MVKFMIYLLITCSSVLVTSCRVGRLMVELRGLCVCVW